MYLNDLPFAQDRSRGWRELREAGEVVTSGTELVLTSAAAVEFATKKPEVFSSARAFDRLGSPVPLVPIAIDPPEHTRFRCKLDPFFSRKKMKEREPELRRQASELIDAIVAKGQCEVMADLATPFPSQVFLTLFGLPLQDRDKFVHWKESILQFTDPSNDEMSPEGLAQALELFTYLTEHIAERRTTTEGNDMLTQLMQDTKDGEMTDNEILGLCFLFVLAGLDTVTSAVGFSFAKLATDANLRHRINADFALIPKFVENMLRVDAHFQDGPARTRSGIRSHAVDRGHRCRAGRTVGQPADEHRDPRVAGTTRTALSLRREADTPVRIWPGVRWDALDEHRRWLSGRARFVLHRRPRRAARSVALRGVHPPGVRRLA